MKYKVGKNKAIAVYTTIESFINGKCSCTAKNDCIEKGKLNITMYANPLGYLVSRLSPLLLTRILFSVQVTLFIFTRNIGTKVKDKIKLAKANIGIKLAKKSTIAIPNTIPSQKIKFQRLSLLRRALIKPTFGWAGALGLSYMPPYSFGTGIALKGLFFDKYLEKSSIDLLLLYNLWLGLYNFIISKYNRKAKLLKALIMWFAFSLCITTTAKAETTGVESNMTRKVAALNKANQQELTHVQTKELITVIERIYSIPPGLLTAIAEVESGFSPYVLGVGGKSLKFDNKEAAIAKLEELAQQGITNIDVGVMQINLKWHQGKFQSLEEMLTPFKNIEYAAKLLASLHRQYGDWHKAVRIYHSKKREHHLKYSKKVVLAWLNSSAQGN